jgi:hypothetical protein
MERRKVRQLLECASPLALFHRSRQASPFLRRLKIIRDLQPVNFEAVNGFHHGG